MNSGKEKIISLNHNIELGNIFEEMSSCYKYLGNEERFRAIAYSNAAKTLYNLTEPVDLLNHNIKKLDELKGVGESIAEKIIEYLDTGKIATHEQLKKNVPIDLFDLMKLDGVGPATIRNLHSELNVNSKEELRNKLMADLTIKIKSVNKNSLETIRRELNISTDKKKRIAYSIALNIGENLLNEINKIKEVHHACLAGSLRRKKETIGDIDIIVTADEINHKRIINDFLKIKMIDKVLMSGNKKASVLLKNEKIQADLRIVKDNEYGAALLYFTGSKEHNILLRSIAKRKGMKINEYGVYDNSNNKRIAGETESSIYKILDLEYVQPEFRLGKNELTKVEH